MELVSYSHGKGIYVYHLEWKTKYAYKMFREPKYAKACEEILCKIAERHKMELLEVAVLSEHVHVVMRTPPSICPTKAKQLLKGGSSYEGHLWSSGNFGRTVSDVDLDTARTYVREQAREYQQLTLPQFS